eukprot:364905-Chlamydomonas_euryale.AAC.11
MPCHTQCGKALLLVDVKHAVTNTDMRSGNVEDVAAIIGRRARVRSCAWPHGILHGHAARSEHHKCAAGLCRAQHATGVCVQPDSPCNPS